LVLVLGGVGGAGVTAGIVLLQLVVVAVVLLCW
jgi:hypothetical protein